MRRTVRHKKAKQTCKRTWGYHLIIDAAGCDPKAIRSKSHIAKFVKALVKEIDMVAFGKPIIVRFGSGNKYGYSLVQLIHTSNITAHFIEESNDIYLDIFSCKSYKLADVCRVFDHYFNPSHKKTKFLKRQA
jgi:S-adenosylmethionine/arginine decarboxylase-like enzyme